MKDYLLYEKASLGDLYFPVEVRRLRAHGSGLIFNSHWHEHMELLFFLEGRASIECSSYRYEVKPGDLIFINSNEVHTGYSTGNSLDYCCIMFDTPFLFGNPNGNCEQKYITPIAQNLVLFKNRISDDSKAVDCVRNILEESDGKSSGYELFIKSAIFQLLGILFRDHIGKVMAKKEVKIRILNLERLNKVLTHIENNYTEDVSIEHLAEMTCLSVYHFCHLFKHLTGKSVNKYINQIRVDKAVHLLKNTDMNITEIAMSTGFNDANYFSRMFHKHKQISPSAMRRQ